MGLSRLLLRQALDPGLGAPTPRASCRARPT